MSFISILKRIGTTALGVERFAAPIVSLALPQLAGGVAIVDGMFLRLQSTIATVEANDPRDGQGGIKAPAVIADFQASLDFTQQILTVEKKKLIYDEAALKEAIDAQVSAFNAMAKVKASFKVVAI